MRDNVGEGVQVKASGGAQLRRRPRDARRRATRLGTSGSAVILGEARRVDAGRNPPAPSTRPRTDGRQGRRARQAERRAYARDVVGHLGDERLDALEGDHAADAVREPDLHAMAVEVEARLIQHVRLDLARRTSSNVGLVPTEIAAG
jgi:hypothetical protein